MKSMAKKVWVSLVRVVVLWLVFGAIFRFKELQAIYIAFYTTFSLQSLIGWIIPAIVAGIQIEKIYRRKRRTRKDLPES